MKTSDAQPEPLQLPAMDGFPLGATRFVPTHGTLQGRIVVAGATGVPQSFYAAFAAYAASAGFETLTFDYRGIGRSKTGLLVGFRASFLDWARLDLCAAIQSMPDDGIPLFLVGHSFGGHAIGMLPNHDRLRAASIFGGGAGFHGWAPPLERVRLWAFWNVVFPPLVRYKGYLPMRRLGIGEDLPLGVYQQWRRWCSFPRYYLDDPDMAELKAACARVRMPMLAVTSLDDAWASPRSREAFLPDAYPQADLTRYDFQPRELGATAIGHVGYFRRHASALWQRALTWFSEQSGTLGR